MVIKPDLERSVNSGTQKMYRFENGYGASVVRHSFSYGRESGLWELAVITFEGDDILQFNLCYSSPITNGVIGNLSESEVEDYLLKIKDLPSHD